MADSNTHRRRKRKPFVLPRPHHIPHVLLLIDTAGAVGRGMVEGIGRYAAENGPWSIQYEYRALDSLPPKWLKQWQGDGIIARTIYAKQAKAIQEAKLPYVELFGHPKSGVAEVWCDYFDEGKKSVAHFLNCGLRNFGYFAFGDTWWIREHREPYVEYLKEQGYDCHVYPAPNARERSLSGTSGNCRA